MVDEETVGHSNQRVHMKRSKVKTHFSEFDSLKPTLKLTFYKYVFKTKHITVRQTHNVKILY